MKSWRNYIKPVLGLLFLMVNIIATSTGSSNTVIAGILLGICLSFIYASKREGDSLLTSLVGLLCYTWSSSWRNIFGGSFADLPIPWFYLIGLVIVLYVLLCSKFKLQFSIFSLIWFLITLGIVPVMISPNFSEAITEYITLLFFYIVVGTVHFAKVKIKESEYFSVLQSFVYANVITSIAIIIQFAVQYFHGYNFIKSSQVVLTGGRRMASSLMFGDISSATICLGLGVIVVMMDLKKFKHPYIISLCIVGGMALSSARTGFITLILTSILYIILDKNTVNKLKVVFISSLAGLTGMVAFYIVRKISTINVLLVTMVDLLGTWQLLICG